MPATKYTYSIQTDFPNQAVDPARLAQEVQASAIVTALDYISTSGDDCDVWFKDGLSAGDKTILDGIVAAHSGLPLPTEAKPVTLSNVLEDDANRLRVSAEPRKAGSSLVIVSHNWCDPRTWYTQSLRANALTLTDSGDGLTFNSGIANWIDLTHGRLYREDVVAAAYTVVVKVDGAIKTQRAPWATTGGDFAVNYETGQVTFFESQAGKAVTADFSYANGSRFVVSPTPGKLLWVEKSEVQFSDDVDLRDTIHFCPYAYNPGDPVGPKIPVAAPTTYKRAQDFVDEANGTYPQVPAFGGLTRGLSVPHLVFPFNYLALKELRASYGVEIRVWLDQAIAFGGSFATATFYCTSFDE